MSPLIQVTKKYMNNYEYLVKFEAKIPNRYFDKIYTEVVIGPDAETVVRKISRGRENFTLIDIKKI